MNKLESFWLIGNSKGPLMIKTGMFAGGQKFECPLIFRNVYVINFGVQKLDCSLMFRILII